MAKQFGVTDAALDGLKDPAGHAFPPDQRAALIFADAMTDGPGHVPDDDFAELLRHFNEAQIVEIACVIGLFNYFNRFNNALHVEITLIDPDVLVRRIEEATATVPTVAELAIRATEILQVGRRYSAVGIYRREDDRLVRIAGLGEIPASLPAREDYADDATEKASATSDPPLLVVRALRDGAVAAAVAFASDRRPAFDEEDRSLASRVAEIVAARAS